jgi:hypothetical protein
MTNKTKPAINAGFFLLYIGNVKNLVRLESSNRIKDFTSLYYKLKINLNHEA